MCGIVGAANRDRPLPLDQLAKAREALRHRGPDDEGEFISEDGRVVLGFRRLSIIDLSRAANQPLANEDGNVRLVFNGEIYNFQELRKELVGRGHRFASRADSETIVHLYEELGPQAVERLRGMFALAIWDERERRLLLARDRLGIKPLYYGWDGSRLVFASELKALLASGSVGREIDLEAFADYLTHGYVPHDRSLVNGVRKLLPGHRLVLELDGTGEPRVEQYWDVEYHGCVTAKAEAAAGVADLLQDSVEEHLVSDVPLGLFLSGGIDSTSVLACMAPQTTSPVQAFGIGYEGGGYDLTAARVAAEVFRANLHERSLDGDHAAAVLDRMSELYDEPMVDTSTIPTYHVSRFAREQVTVALSGDGGDEVFGGYRWHFRFLEGRRQHDRVVSRLPFAPELFAAVLPGLRRFPYATRASVLGRTLHRGPEEGYFRHVGLFDGWEQRRLGGPTVEGLLRDRDPLWLFRRFFHHDLPPLTAVRYLDLKTYLPDDILTKVDRASMACSLEVRVPLLDHRLVEYAFDLDDRLLGAHPQGKAVLREAMAGKLPDLVLERPKSGFSSPVRRWLREGLAAGLADPTRWTIAEAGLVRPAFVREMMRNRSFNRWAKLWSLLVLERWHQRWIAAASG